MKPFLLLIFLALMVGGCKKNAEPAPVPYVPPVPPPVVVTVSTLSTIAITEITDSAATTGGNISADGGAAVTARGVCWGLTPAPSLSGNYTSDSTGTGAFKSVIKGLHHSTVYYVRAYATNSAGTAYGNELILTSAPDVYVTGYETNASHDIGYLWKNGKATALSTPTVSSRGYSIYVADTNVYIAGSLSNGSHTVATVWKNGIPSALTDGSHDAEARSIIVTGTDVYVAGYDNNGTVNLARVWKNAAAMPLTLNQSKSELYSLSVSGTDVYAAGQELESGNSRPKIWKNGSPSMLSDNLGYAQSVFAAGADVYATGAEKNAVTLYKNGIPVNLPGSNPASEGHCVFAAGSDVYVGGFDSYSPGGSGTSYRATLWKNGAETMLPADGYSMISGVFVAGTYVYAAGSDRYNNLYVVPKIWKNGVATTLPSNAPNNCFALSVFAK